MLDCSQLMGIGIICIFFWLLTQGYTLCPYCYSHPPFREMRKGMACNECTHPSCSNSLAMTGVSACAECDSGTLVLDLMSAPKWRIVCNRWSVALCCWSLLLRPIFITVMTGRDIQSLYFRAILTAEGLLHAPNGPISVPTFPGKSFRQVFILRVLKNSNVDAESHENGVKFCWYLPEKREFRCAVR